MPLLYIPEAPSSNGTLSLAKQSAQHPAMPALQGLKVDATDTTDTAREPLLKSHGKPPPHRPPHGKQLDNKRTRSPAKQPIESNDVSLLLDNKHESTHKPAPLAQEQVHTHCLSNSQWTKCSLHIDETSRQIAYLYYNKDGFARLKPLKDTSFHFRKNIPSNINYDGIA